MIEKLLNVGSIIPTLYNSIDNGEKITIFGCEMDAKLTLLKESGKSIFFVTNDIKDAISVKEKFVNSGYRVEMLMDKLDFKLTPFQNEYNQNIIGVLNKILTKQIDVIIANPMFLHYILPKVKWLEERNFSVYKGQQISPEGLTEKLIKMGLERSDIPCAGQFKVKGDMVDINLSDIAFRVYFDFDEVESIKTYDKESLINIDSIDEYSILSNNWFDNIYENLPEFEDSEISNAIETYGTKLDNILWCLPFANNVGDTIIDYLDDDFVVAFLDTKQTTNYLQEEVKNYNEFIKSEKYFSEKFLINSNIDFKDISVVGYQYITNQNRLFSSNRVFNIKTIPVSNYVGNSKLLVVDMNQCNIKNYTTVLFAGNNDNVKKLTEIFDVNKIKYNIAKTLFDISKNTINIIAKRSATSINLEVEKILIVGTLNLFGKPKPVLKKSEVESFAGFLPQSGDYVVHTTHGIGKCIGVECLKLSTSKRDYVVIEYQNNDRLYLPVENIDLIDKYIGDNQPKLHKLGGTEFLKTKERVRKTVKELAFNLTKLYAERNSLRGFEYPKDDEIMQEFEESFGYVETPDQLQAIQDIKSDMISGKVMDRLICGDVGFGKTEVAIRTAFKTILAGKQVAFLCPTTILSQQHYNTALIRMKNFGVNIRVLNRFCSTKELNQIYSGLENGEIDLIVGTHKLLNSKIKFKNLGLLILDEEQKFGVGDKEKIKNLKKNINVLTLSATPIPRTLNMSLVGIRDISVIETAPVSRIPTAVKVVEYSEDILRNAIDVELERGGQVLVVYNRVDGIYEFSNKIRNLYPNISVDVAHGQMEQEKLENAIFKLYNNDTQILVSTTLIENGIDLPNANTLIVIDSDMLGLSQLYQLKGRVGRSDRQAFAYFTYNGGRLLTDTAFKRLEAITEYTSMGSGFKIALKDLEIRGAGSIFGAEQSGHIEKVGYAMYLKLLSEVVGEIKGNSTTAKREVKVETSLNAFIPNEYIVDYNQRMSVYLKISKIDTSSKLMGVLTQIGEIYGEVPDEIVNLCKIALVKNLAEKHGFNRICLKSKDVSMYLDVQPNEKLIDALDCFSKYFVLENKVSSIIKLKNDLSIQNSLDLLVNFLEFMSN